jgi:hypothetical protein
MESTGRVTLSRDVARCLAPSPALGKEVEDVEQVDVGKQPRSYLAHRHGPVFQDTRLEPFLDQANDALVADSMFQEAPSAHATVASRLPAGHYLGRTFTD